MKTLKTFFVLLAMVVTSSSYGQEKQMPNKEETIRYIDKILQETIGFDYCYESGECDQVENIYMTSSNVYMEWAKENDDDNEYGWRQARSYLYKKIDFQNLISVTDCGGEKDGCDKESYGSSIKELHLNFRNGTVLKTLKKYDEAYWGPKGGDKNWRYSYQDRSVSTVWVYYKDTPGTRERLIKAFNHLIELAKKEKENDPFGN